MCVIIKESAVLILFVIATLFFIRTVTAADEGFYYNNMYNISDALKNGKANVLVVGDSINSQTSSPTMFMGYMMSWRPNNWRGMMIQPIAGASQGTVVFNTPSTSVANVSVVRPGQRFFHNDSSMDSYDFSWSYGVNVNRIAAYHFYTDFTIFGTAIQTFVQNFSTWSDDWTNNTNLTARMIYLSDPNFTRASMKATLRNGTSTSGEFNVQFNNTPTRSIYWKDILVNASTGSSSVGGWLQAGNANESSPNFSFYYPMGSRLFRTDIQTGLQMGFVGEGGFTTRSHWIGENKTIDGFNFISNYTDAALRDWINASDSNIFMIWLGQNSADNEWDGNTVRNYSNNVMEIMKRYTRLYQQVNSTGTPYFILVSPYDSGTTNTRYTQMETALLNLSRQYPTITGVGGIAQVGFLNLRNKVNITNGSWEQWNNTYTQDGIHTSAIGAATFARYLWEEVNNSYYNYNVYTNGTLLNVTWQKESVLINNRTLDTRTLQFNNTVPASRSLRFYNATNLLTYNLTGGVLCSNVDGCDNNVNITIAPNDTIYVLDNFNLTQNETRLYSPLWFSSTNTSSVNVSSNLTQTINTTLVINVTTCANLTNIRYISHTGTYNLILNASNYTCTDTLATIPGIPIEPANSSNLLYWNYSIPATVTTTDDSSSGSSGTTNQATRYWYSTYDNTNTELSVTQTLSTALYTRERVRIKVNGEQHTIGIVAINGNVATINISSTPQQITLAKNESKNVDLEKDGYYDLIITLNDIVANRAQISMRYIHELVVTQAQPNTNQTVTPQEEKKPNNNLALIGLIALVCVVVLVIGWLVARYREHKRWN